MPRWGLAMAAAAALAAALGWPGGAHADRTRPRLNLNDDERAAAFRAAGAVQRAGRWLLCPQHPDGEGDASIGAVARLGGDARLAVIVSGENAACFGGASNGFRVLERNAHGRWTQVYASAGNARFGVGNGADGWPDLLLIPDTKGCRRVLRWDGRAWQHRRTPPLATTVAPVRGCQQRQAGRS